LQDFSKACKQELNSRIWKRIELDTVFSIRGYEKTPILYPLRVKIDSKGNIYVLDVYAPAVLKFSSQGKFIQKYGKGKGKGPGEFERLHDFSVSLNGEVYVCDVTTGLVTIFHPNGNVEETIRTKGLPGQIASLGDKSFIIAQTGIGELFQKYGFDGQLLTTFGKFFDEQSTYALPVDIWITSFDQRLYAAFGKAGYIVSYDKDGNLNFLCETIDKFPPPKFKITQTREKGAYVTRVAPDIDAPTSALDISVSDSLIYILALDASKKEKAVVIDIYRIIDGKYLYSFKFGKLPGTEGVQSCVVSKNFMYTAEILKDGNALVRKYKLKFL